MSDAPKSAAPPYRRSAKNYLLDRHFQLKYAGILAGTALVISAALFGLVWQTSSEVIEQSQKTVERGQKTVERGQEVLVQSRRVSQVVSMNIAKEYKDDPVLAKTFSDEAAKDEQKLNDEQDRLVREQQQLEGDRAFLVRQQRRITYGLAFILSALVVTLGLVGIVFTHRVAGPIFKMKRLLGQIGRGKLVLRERLRKGDELQDFFEAFEAMVDELRKSQEVEIAKVDRILERLEAAPVSARGNKEMDADGVEMLRRLRKEMQDQLEV